MFSEIRAVCNGHRPCKLYSRRNRLLVCFKRTRRLLKYVFLAAVVSAIVAATSGKMRQSSNELIPRHRVISPWERAYCQLDHLGLSLAEFRTRCEEAFEETGNTDEIACLSLLTARSPATLTKECVSSDYTDVSVNVPLLHRLRKQRIVEDWSKNLKPYVNLLGRFLGLRRSGVLISLCVKDETRMLLFSMLWHLLLGVDHYFICDNSSTGSSLERVLKPFSGTGLLTMTKYTGSGEIQQRCFDDALKFASSKGYKWQGGLDSDEFTVISDRFRSLEAALDHFAGVTLQDGRKVGAVALNWLSQPPYNQTSIHYPNDLCVTPAEKHNFLLRNSDKNRHVKSFGLTGAILNWSHVHMPLHFREPKTVTVNPAGAPIPSIPAMFDTEPAVSDAAVVHFTYRTIQELAAKRERGRATVDCESEESVADQNCAVVHSARRSKRKVSELADQYMLLLAKPSDADQESEADDEHLRYLRNAYRRLGAQVKQVISCSSYARPTDQ